MMLEILVLVVALVSTVHAGNNTLYILIVYTTIVQVAIAISIKDLNM